MQIYDVLARAQGGHAIENLARAANVEPGQMDAAFKAVIPYFSSAIERNTLSRGGLADFVKALGDGHHEVILDNPEAMADPRVAEDGRQVLEHVLGSKDRSRAVAYQAAQASGLSEGLIKMLLPYIAQMLMGAIAKWAKGGLGDVLGKLPGGTGGGGTGGGGTGGGGNGLPFPFPMPGGGQGGGQQDSGGRDGSGGGRERSRDASGRGSGGPFELPRSDMPQGGFPMPPMPGNPDGQGRDPQQGDGGDSRDGRFQIPWPRPRDPAPPIGGDGRGGGGPFSLPRSEMPQGGFPMPPIPGGTADGTGYPAPTQQGGGQGGGLPLPMPGGGDTRENPYGDLSDILRRGGSSGGGGGSSAGAGPLGGLVRNILGGLMGFGGRGIVGWLIRLLVVRFGWGLLRRLLGRMLTGR